MPRPPLQLLPGVPDPPTPSGRAGFSERGFRREGKGKGPGQDVARGGGLHRAFLALPVKRTFWRFFKGEMALVAWQVAITFDLLMAGRTNAAADTLGLLRPARSGPGLHRTCLAADFATRPAAGAFLRGRCGPRHRGPALLPSGRPEVDHFGPGLFTGDGPDRLPEGRVKAKTKEASRSSASPSTGQPGAADDAALSKKQLRAAQWAAKRAK